jgi:hypothetical protein
MLKQWEGGLRAACGVLDPGTDRLLLSGGSARRHVARHAERGTVCAESVAHKQELWLNANNWPLFAT